MPESNGSEIPDLFSKIIRYNYPCDFEESLVPNEVHVKVIVGSQTVYILAPVTRVNSTDGTIEVSIVGQVGDSYLLSFPGEVENGTSTMRVDKSLVNIR